MPYWPHHQKIGFMPLPKVDRTTGFLILIAIALGGVAWARGGASLALSGVILGGRTLLGVTPILLAAFLVAGLTQVMITKEMVETWLSASSGWRGILLACVAGALIPGGPYVYYPISAVLLKTGASLGVLVAFVTAKNIWSVSRLPLEFALLGPRLILARLAVTLVLPPLLGFVAEALFGRRVERIRQAVSS